MSLLLQQWSWIKKLALLVIMYLFQPKILGGFRDLQPAAPPFRPGAPGPVALSQAPSGVARPVRGLCILEILHTFLTTKSLTWPVFIFILLSHNLPSCTLPTKIFGDHNRWGHPQAPATTRPSAAPRSACPAGSRCRQLGQQRTSAVVLRCCTSQSALTPSSSLLLILPNPCIQISPWPFLPRRRLQQDKRTPSYVAGMAALYRSCHLENK